MTNLKRMFAALCTVALAAPAVADSAATDGAPPPQTVVLKVGVDATGHVQSTASIDPQAVPAYLQAAEAYARKLVFTPARKGGVPAPSETYLSLVIATEPVGDGKFGLKLRRAVNGPGVAKLGKLDVPKYQGRRSSALIVVSVDIDAEGNPDMDSFKSEQAQLRDDNSFAEARYLDAIRNSVKHSVFVPDRVAGAPVASRVTLPYRFGAGGGKPKQGEDEGGRGKRPPPVDPSEQPTMQGVSKQPDVELPKIDYKAPASGA
jgi:hypothetical protein